MNTAKLTTGNRRPVSRPSTLEREAAVSPKNDLPSHSGYIHRSLSQILEEPLCLECRYHHEPEEDCIDWRDDPANFHPDSQGA